MSFDARDPFPLARLSHEEAKLHSEAVDAWLGLDTHGVEKQISDTRAGPENQELWIGLPVSSLLTPYTELRQALAELGPAPASLLIDLGSGYGRLGFVLARHYPEVRFLGYELLEERVAEGAKALRAFGAKNAELRRADLADSAFQLEEAEAYFMYDYGSREAVAKTLSDLRVVAARRPIAVVGRGRLTRDRIERAEPWLSQIVAPRHLGNFSIYRSA